MNILVGVDGSTSSMRAGAYAVGLARRQHGRLVAVYVRARPSALLPLVDGGGAGVATLVDAQEAVEQELRDAFTTYVPQLLVDAQLLVRTGEPYAELAAVAEQIQADAVIVGRSTKMLHRVAGSVSVKLVRCGRWPVTVVP